MQRILTLLLTAIYSTPIAAQTIEIGQGGSEIGGSVSGGTPGSVLFVGAGPVLAQDNTNFFWNNALKRLGIGVASPTSPLTVAGVVESTSGGFKFPDASVQTTAASSTPPGGATGAVQFNNAGAFGGNAPKLYWDNATFRFGIGTATPSAPLSVEENPAINGSVPIVGRFMNNGDQGARVRLGLNDTVGGNFIDLQHTFGGGLTLIGGASGTSTLFDVQGNADATFYGTTINYAQNGPHTLFSAAGAGETFTVKMPGDIIFNQYFAGFAETVRFKDNGSVGIGTSTPAQKLSVVGTIESTSGGFKFPDATVQTTAATAVVPGAVNGTVQFNSSGTFGGSGYFLWDDANASLGIGGSPGAAQQVIIDSGYTATDDVVGLVITRSDDGNNFLSFTASHLGERSSMVANTNLEIGTGGYTKFSTAGGTERMRMTPAGRFGIGTTTPASPLTVAGVVESTSGGFKFPDATTQTTAAATPAIGGTLTSAAAGSVLFAGSGTFAQNNSKFFWDNTNTLLGLGTATPSGNLDIVNSTYGQFLVHLSSPAGGSTGLVIDSGLAIGINAHGSAGGIVGTADTSGIGVHGQAFANIGVEGSDTGGGTGVRGMSANGYAGWFSATGIGYGLIVDTGNVGIGTTTPSARLSVEQSPVVNGSAPIVGRFMNNGDTGARIRLGLNDTAGGFFTDIQHAYGDGLSFIGGASGTSTVFKIETNATADFYGSTINLNGGGPHTLFSSSGAGETFTVKMPGDIIFNQYSAGFLETVRIKDNGRVGIGTPTPATKLDVNGNVNITDAGATGGNVYHGYTRRTSTTTTSATCSASCAAGEKATGGGCTNTAGVAMQNNSLSSDTQQDCTYLLATGDCTANVYCAQY